MLVNFIWSLLCVFVSFYCFCLSNNVFCWSWYKIDLQVVCLFCRVFLSLWCILNYTFFCLPQSLIFWVCYFWVLSFGDFPICVQGEIWKFIVCGLKGGGRGIFATRCFVISARVTSLKKLNVDNYFRVRERTAHPTFSPSEIISAIN